MVQQTSPAGEVRYETRALTVGGRSIEGLHVIWITLCNAAELNSFTTEMLEQLEVAFRRASADRRAVAVVLTGDGDRAFCSGGNTREYSQRYAGRVDDYRRYMRIFIDAMDSILACDHPVINRVNGLRVGGGQELGLSCDFSVTSDLARFSQAGPRHGSSPDGGATDMLPLLVGVEQAARACSLCEMWSAHKALRLGLVSGLAPVLSLDGRFVPNPTVITDRALDEWGRPCLGEPLTGAALEEGRRALARGRVSFDLLDAEVQSLVERLASTFPGCASKALASIRKHKLEPWRRNADTNREWLALNMLTEARAGFRAFESGIAPREVDFFELRRRLADGQPWSEELIASVQPGRDRNPER